MVFFTRFLRPSAARQVVGVVKSQLNPCHPATFKTSSTTPSILQRCFATSASSSSGELQEDTPLNAGSAGMQLSTAYGLPLAGGDTTRELRMKTHHEIMKSYSNIKDYQAQPHAKMHPRDVIATNNIVFIGVGLETNWSGLLTALDKRIFGDRRIVVVRDIFDRNNEHRRTLSDWFSIIADDIVAIHLDCEGDILQNRLVNVYAPHISAGETAAEGINDSEGFYKLTRNDVDLIEYLHSTGWRVVKARSKQHLRNLDSGLESIPLQQSTNHVLICAPTAFNYNEGAAVDNHFMLSEPSPNSPDNPSELIKDDHKLRRKVLTEFANLHHVLVDKNDGIGVQAHLFTHEDYHNTPDACFPNNTFSTHTNLEINGSETCMLILYPMKDETRRKERRLVQRLLTRGVRYTQVYDLTREEQNNQYLEGTGSLVLDRINRIGYLAISQRSDLNLALRWSKLLNYRLVPFHSVDKFGRAIYHTNVMMSVGTNIAIVCSESIVDEGERRNVLNSLRDSGKTIIDINWNQVEQFCGNAIELESFHGKPMFIMSSKAYHGFTEAQREDMLTDGRVSKLVHADISTIEAVGGGGVRCTIAELF